MFGSRAIHMVGGFFQQARNFGESMVSIDTKIKHAKKDIQALDSDIRSLMHDIAIEEEKCEDVKEEVSDKSAALAKLQVHMTVLNKHLTDNASQHYVARDGRSHTPNQVKTNLASSLKRYKTQRVMLTALEKQLESRIAILASAKDKLEETRRVKAELMGELEALEAEHRMNEVSKITSNFKLDNSRLSKAKEAVKKLRTEIRVEGNMVNQVQDGNHIQTEPIQSDDIENVTAQFEAMFGKSSGVAQK